MPRTRKTFSLIDLYWNTRVAHFALQTKDAKKYDKVNVLPLTEDLKRLSEATKNAIESQTAAGVNTREEFVGLTKRVLSRLLVFNKRRPTEVSRILLSSWVRREEFRRETTCEIKENMGRLERQLYNKMDVVMVRGKCGNRVPVLIPEDNSKALNLLVSVREKYVEKGNKFLLAALSNKGHYEGSQVLKAAVDGMGLSEPSLFTATRLRKYCGTTSQMLSLSDEDFEILTRHMGHDKDVHRKYYRLPDTTLELTKAAALMTCLDAGKVSQYAGKDLGTILELGEENEELDEVKQAEMDEEKQAEMDKEKQAEMPKKRPHKRFTAQQTALLAALLKARGNVPKMADLKTWLQRQGTVFVGKSAAQVRAKLHNMLRSSVSDN